MVLENNSWRKFMTDFNNETREEEGNWCHIKGYIGGLDKSFNRLQNLKEFMNILIPKMESIPLEITMTTKDIKPTAMELAVAIKDYIDTGNDFQFRQIM